MIRLYTAETLFNSPLASLIVNNDNPKHMHTFWEITYCLNGTLTHIVNSETFIQNALETIVIIPPGATHEIRFKYVSEEYRHRDIYVKDDKMRKICDLLRIGLYDELANSTNGTEIAANDTIFNELEQTLSLFNNLNQFEKAEPLEALHTCVIVKILALYLQHNFESSRPIPRWINDFIGELNREEILRKNVEELIATIPYSHGHACREFKKYFGKTIVQFINERRLQYSTILLMDKSLTILQISMRLNFCAQGAYINAFKKYYGMSPNKWRSYNLKANDMQPQSKWGQFLSEDKK